MQQTVNLLTGSAGALVLSAAARALPAPAAPTHLLFATFDKAEAGNDVQSNRN
jgi:hypothetical protein